MNLFDKKISVYSNVLDKTGIVTTMQVFLNSTRHRAAIAAIRACDDPHRQSEMKKKLPGATFSGVFSPKRGADHLTQHSGYICIDIDAQDNPQFDHPSQMLALLKTRPEVAYAALSIRGKGYYALIPLAHPELPLVALTLQTNFFVFFLSLYLAVTVEVPIFFAVKRTEVFFFLDSDIIFDLLDDHVTFFMFFARRFLLFQTVIKSVLFPNFDAAASTAFNGIDVMQSMSAKRTAVTRIALYFLSYISFPPLCV